jgi:hypothetical protein
MKIRKRTVRFNVKITQVGLEMNFHRLEDLKSRVKVDAVENKRQSYKGIIAKSC